MGFPRPRLPEVHRGFLAVAELQMAGDEIGMEVGQEHVRDSAAELVRVIKVPLGVARGSTMTAVSLCGPAMRSEACADSRPSTARGSWPARDSGRDQLAGLWLWHDPDVRPRGAGLARHPPGLLGRKRPHA